MWPFNRSETKSQDYITETTLEEYADLLTGQTSGYPKYIRPKEAYNLSERNADLGDAVSRISSSISSLNVGIQRGEEINYNDPLVQLLNYPKEGYSGAQFWQGIAESYLLTSECWIIARGGVSRPPLSLTFMFPYNVTVVLSESDGLPLAIQTQCKRDRRIYYRETINGDIRFIDKPGLNEIFPIIGEVSLQDEYRGRSKLGKLYYDLKMNTDGKRHNVSLLKNGMRTTAIITPKPVKDQNAEWGGDVVKKLAQKLRSFNQGAGVAGNTLVGGRPMEVQGLTQNNREMDFLSLLKNSQVAIYNLYQIPLPLVLADTMTLDNYTQAQRAYYTKAVFPVFDDIAAGIMQTVGKRYKKDPAIEKLTFRESDIRDMRPVLVENMKSMKDSQVLSTNEIRKEGGYEADPAGDEILVAANQVPLSMVAGASFGDVNGPGTESDEEQD